METLQMSINIGMEKLIVVYSWKGQTRLTHINKAESEKYKCQGKKSKIQCQLYYAVICVTLKKNRKHYGKPYMIYHKSIKYMEEKIHISFRILVTSGARGTGMGWERASTLSHFVFSLKKKQTTIQEGVIWVNSRTRKNSCQDKTRGIASPLISLVWSLG